MRRSVFLAVPAALAVLVVLSNPAHARKEVYYPNGQLPPPAKLAKYDANKPALPLLDDDAHSLVTHLTNDYDGSQFQQNASSEDIDVFAGASAMRVTGVQRHCARIANWNFPIVETPKEGQFRYVRFAWKKKGGTGIAMQFHDQNRTWIARYHAGKNVHNWNPCLEVAKDMPTDWTVVTRDLFKDFGAMTVTGVSFAPLDGDFGLFDHLVFGRTLEELDAATAAATGKGKPTDTMEPKYREALWEHLGERDRALAGEAVRQFLVAAPESAAFIAERLQGGQQSPEDVKTRTRRIATLVESLGIETDFDTRLSACEELEKLGAAAETALRGALSSGDPEKKYRVTRLMSKLKLDAGGEGSLAAAKAGRIVRILERAATAEAKELLKKMSDGGYGAEFLDPATEALTRLK